MNKIILFLILFSLSGFIRAQTPLEKLEEGYATRREALDLERELEEVKLRKSYHAALEKLMEQVRSQGDFPYFVDVENELKRTTDSLEAPKELSSREELKTLQEILIAELNALDDAEALKWVALHGKMDQALVQLQQLRLREGNVSAAKEIETLRQETRSEERVASAYAREVNLSPQPTPAPVGVAGNILSIQNQFAGKVTAYNAITREIEIEYDFSSEAQLKDFKLKPSKHFKIEGGQLIVTAPRGSDWWVTRAEIDAPTLLIPFVDADNFEVEVEMVSVNESPQYHFALGISDLKSRTIGIGPFGGGRQIAVEGWTPEEAELRVTVDAQKYPAVLTMIRKGDEIEFRWKTDSKTEKRSVATDAGLRYPGLFPKAWGAEGAIGVYQSLSIKGKLNREGVQRP